MARAWIWTSWPVATAVPVILLLAIGPPPVAATQPGEECWRYARVLTGRDGTGDPVYGWELVDTCEDGADDAGRGNRICRHATRGAVPCHDPVWGWWSDAVQCYVSVLDPQPPAGDRLWEGHEPADGAVYQLRCPGDAADVVGTQPSIRLEFFPAAPRLPTTVQFVRQAMRRLVLRPADIGVEPDPDGAGLVGLPVWLWTDNPEVTWGPVSISVAGPGITVTAEGRATSIEWDMGDGSTVVCDGPGTPYESRYGAGVPDCGHAYAAPSSTRPDGRYRIRATTEWHVRWWVEPRGSGAEGEDYVLREATTSIRINDLHVVTS